MARCALRSSRAPLLLALLAAHPPAVAAGPRVPAATQLAVGRNFSCALVAGEVFCWGANDRGQLGDGTRAARARPVRARKLPGLQAISAGSEHVCVLAVGGEVWCWGSGTEGARQIAKVPGARHIASHDERSCVLALGDPSGARLEPTPGAYTTCWSFDERLEATPESPRSAPGGDISSFMIGRAHACAARRDGPPVCWGSNRRGALGSPDLPTSVEKGVEAGGWHGPVPVAIPATATTVSAARDGSCAIDREGRLWCWGACLGCPPAAVALPGPAVAAAGDAVLLGSGVVHWKGERVAGLDDAVQLAAGSDHGCAIRRSGEIACWGENHDGQLGNGESRHHAGPVDVVGVTHALDVAVSHAQACVLERAGTVLCWDDTPHGDRRSAVAKRGLLGATAIAATPDFVCALHRGRVSCWLAGDRPQALPGVMDAVAISGPCLVRKSGNVLCQREQEGRWPGPLERLRGLPPAARFEAGCATTRSGGVLCRDEDGWAPIVGVRRPRRIVASWAFTAAILEDGEVRSWDWLSRDSRRIASDAVAAAGTANGLCLVETSGAVRCDERPIAGITDAVEISAQRELACVVRRGGQVRCWGAGPHADGLVLRRSDAVAVSFD